MGKIDKLTLVTKVNATSSATTKNLENFIIALPAAFQGKKDNSLIPGVVVRADRGQIMVKTAFGEVILQSSLSVRAGTQLILESHKNGNDIEVKVYVNSTQLDQASTSEGNFKLGNSFLTFKLNGKNITSHQTNDIDKAFVIDSTRQIINAVLINPKAASDNLLNTAAILGAISKLMGKEVNKIDEVLRSGSKTDFKLLKLIDDNPDIPNLSINEEGRLVLAGTIFSNAKFKEATLDTIFGSFTFNNVEFNLENHAKVMLELINIFPSLLKLNENLKLNDLNDLLYFLESLESISTTSLPGLKNTLNINDTSEDDIRFVVNLAMALVKNTETDLLNPDSGIDANLESQIQAAAQAIFKESFKMPWQIFIIPIICHETLQLIKVFIKKIPQNDGQHNSRFIVEFSTSDLGRIVIDGLVIQSKAHSNLSINLKSENVFDLKTETELKELFLLVNQMQGYQGNVYFSSLNNYTSPLAENIRSLCLQKAKEIIA